MFNQTQAQTEPTEKKARKRLTPGERMQKAREALRKAASEQRKSDTRSKIVLGALTMALARNSPSFSSQLLQVLNTSRLRDQDKEALAEYKRELIQICAAHTKAQQNQNAS